MVEHTSGQADAGRGRTKQLSTEVSNRFGYFRVLPHILDQMLHVPPGNTITNIRRREDGTYEFAVMGKDMPEATNKAEYTNNEVHLVYEMEPRHGKIVNSWFTDNLDGA